MDKVYQKWKDYGFLDNLSEEQSIELADGFEYLESILKAHGHTDYICTIAFPVLRRVFTTRPNIELSEEFILEILKNLKEYVNTDMYKKSLKEGASLSTIDSEAELLVLFVKTYYGQ